MKRLVALLLVLLPIFGLPTVDAKAQEPSCHTQQLSLGHAATPTMMMNDPEVFTDPRIANTSPTAIRVSQGAVFTATLDLVTPPIQLFMRSEEYFSTYTNAGTYQALDRSSEITNLWTDQPFDILLVDPDWHGYTVTEATEPVYVYLRWNTYDRAERDPLIVPFIVCQ